MAELRIKQVRSANGADPRQRETLRSLRLGRIGREVEMSDSPQLRGMLRVVAHLVEVDGESPVAGRQAPAGGSEAEGGS